jgi:hypothetical protein
VLTFLKTFVQLHTLGAIYHLREEWQVGHLFLYSTLVFYFFFFLHLPLRVTKHLMVAQHGLCSASECMVSATQPPEPCVSGEASPHPLTG